jgi:hypothetical protein
MALLPTEEVYKIWYYFQQERFTKYDITSYRGGLQDMTLIPTEAVYKMWHYFLQKKGPKIGSILSSWITFQ